MSDTKLFLRWVLVVLILLVVLYSIATVLRLAPDSSRNRTEEPFEEPPNQTKEIVVGVEYVVHGLGEGFSDLGIPAVKPLPESFSWDKMQKAPDDPIDFTITDRYVGEYQDSGFTHIVFGLRVAADLLGGPWMIDERYPMSQAVDPKYRSHYANWVGSIVERYDKDGVEDMPGLRHPVTHYEIGVEFSSYQPEPTEVYLETLRLGYQAAHNASDRAVVAHSAFLLTPVFRDNPGPGEYEKAFANNLVGTAGKGLEDIWMILDRPELFDVINVHNLGWPYEIERIVSWVDYETSKRGYSKPIIISDTIPTAFAGFGPATRCQGDKLAIMFPPSTDADRCRLAEYFKRLIAKDQDYIEWLRRFLAADIVQRVVIAAEQGIELIDTAFTGDIPGANMAIFQAAAGNSGWAGMVDYKTDIVGGGLRVVGRRPAYYSLQQLQKNIRGYTEIRRVQTEEDLRLYSVGKPGETFYIAWYGYKELYLPEDQMPTHTFNIDVGEEDVIIQEMRTSAEASSRRVATNNGVLTLTLSPEPVYILLVQN